MTVPPCTRVSVGSHRRTEHQSRDNRGLCVVCVCLQCPSLEEAVLSSVEEERWCGIDGVDLERLRGKHARVVSALSRGPLPSRNVQPWRPSVLSPQATRANLPFASP